MSLISGDGIQKEKHPSLGDSHFKLKIQFIIELTLGPVGSADSFPEQRLVLDPTNYLINVIN